MKAHGPHYRVPFRRRREGRTDYRHRARLLRSGKPRAVVRKTLNQTIVQIIEPEAPGDRVIASAASRELRKHGWAPGTGNVPAAYLTGFLAGRRAIGRGVTEAVLDIGLHSPTKGARVFGALKGLLDAGLTIAHSPEILPSAERLRGVHIGEPLAQAVEATKSKLEAA